MNNKNVISILIALKDRIKHELGDNFIGAYVHGSFATGDVTDESDLDVVIVIKKDISIHSIAQLQELHGKLYNELESPWGQRLELSYVPIDIFRKQTTYPKDPVDEPRPETWIDPSTQSAPRFYPFWYLDNGAKQLVRSEHDIRKLCVGQLERKGLY